MHKKFIGKPKETSFKNPGADKIIILKWILQKYVVRVWTARTPVIGGRKKWVVANKVISFWAAQNERMLYNSASVSLSITIHLHGSTYGARSSDCRAGWSNSRIIRGKVIKKKVDGLICCSNSVLVVIVFFFCDCLSALRIHPSALHSRIQSIV
jgi:hypothetical protein